MLQAHEWEKITFSFVVLWRILSIFGTWICRFAGCWYNTWL